MAISTIKADFACDVLNVWNVVTSLENYSWRSDLSSIEVRGDKGFIEYTKDGFATIFTVTLEEPYNRWEFDLDNDNISGHWVGVFSFENGVTTVEFTENVTAKKLYMKPFVKSFLRKQQMTYIADLKKALNL